MEETNPSADGTTQDAHGDVEKSASDTVAYETYQKSLKQRHRFKEEAETLRAELESYKTKELEQKGEYKTLVESQRKRISDLENQTRKMQLAYQESVVANQVMDEFVKRGVKSPDKAWKYARSVHKDDLNSIEVDDQYSVNREDLGRFAEKFLNDNVDMGFVKRGEVKDIVPGKIETGNDNKKLSQLSENELAQVWEDANR